MTAQSGRAGLTPCANVERVLDALKAIPERVGPIASAEAQKAIARIIKDASEEIARTAAQKSITTADRISRRQLIVAAVVGALSCRMPRRYHGLGDVSLSRSSRPLRRAARSGPRWLHCLLRSAVMG